MASPVSPGTLKDINLPLEDWMASCWFGHRLYEVTDLANDKPFTRQAHLDAQLQLDKNSRHDHPVSGKTHAVLACEN